ncbi:Hypothetical predicted protein, partial [Olea europaea subsp. europaea]
VFEIEGSSFGFEDEGQQPPRAKRRSVVFEIGGSSFDSVVKVFQFGEAASVSKMEPIG